MLNCVKVVSGEVEHKKDATSAQTSDEVTHLFDLPEKTLERANFLRQASGMQLLNTQFAKKEDRLKEAARLYMRLGRIRDFCEIQFELKKYKKALAFAPGVSIEYWQELSERHASILEQEGKEDAAIACIVANKLDNAVSLFQQREEFEDGKLVKALQLTGGFQSVLSKFKSKDSIPPQPSTQDIKQNLIQVAN